LVGLREVRLGGNQTEGKWGERDRYQLRVKRITVEEEGEVGSAGRQKSTR